MANPRQRRKTRSSSYKPVKQSRRANKILKKQRPIKGPKVLQDAWDNHKTVRQNYAALGLAHTLSPNDSGGQEMPHQRREDACENTERGNQEQTVEAEQCGSSSKQSSAAERIPRGYGRLIRDASGAVVDVILEEDGGIETALYDRGADGFQIEGPVGGPESTDSAPTSGWLLEGTSIREGASGVVSALESLSQVELKKARVSSDAELKYLARLVDAYGEDYGAMAKDRRRNVNQYSAGDLRRAVKKAGLA